MAAPVFFEIGADGSVRTDGLHWEGFPLILWDALRSSGYTASPLYEGLEFEEQGVPCCRVRVTVPPHPDHPEWPELTTKMLSFRLLEAIETAALRVLNAFCDHHPLEVFLTPLGLLPTVDPEDPAWRDRMGHMAALLTATTPLDTVQRLAQCMRALYNLQALRHASVTNLSQQLSDVHGTLRERHTHLHILSLAYLEQDGHLAQAHQRIAGLEARVVQLEIEHGNRLQTIFELQDQRDGLQGLIADLEAERMAHL